MEGRSRWGGRQKRSEPPEPSILCGSASLPQGQGAGRGSCVGRAAALRWEPRVVFGLWPAALAAEALSTSGPRMSRAARARREPNRMSAKKANLQADVTQVETQLRIIGGKFRGRKLHYSGRLDTRPMKHRVREAIFNLVGPSIQGMHAVDLFAGTGALGLEALSRGAAEATFIERHFPTADVIQQNITTLDVEATSKVVVANTFLWARKLTLSTDLPWVVFCSPPYDFYIDRAEPMRELIEGILQAAPAESVLVVEADGRFDPEILPDAETWDVRTYPPALVAIRRIAT